MLTKNESTTKSALNGVGLVWEYGGSEKIDIARALINGRYPENGQSRNKVSDMIYYCLAGKGCVVIDSEESQLEPGDALLIKAAQPYFVQGNNLEILIASSPAWSPDQYEQIG